MAGLGTLHPNLDIQPLNQWGDLTVIQTFDEAMKVFKAPNRNSWDRWHTNNGLENEFGSVVDYYRGDFVEGTVANGFANTSCSWTDPSDSYYCPQEFLITFNDRRVYSFQMLMVDFGDWNPEKAQLHQVYLTGYENGVPVAEYAVEYSTDPVRVPRWTSLGFDPSVSSDASTSNEAGRGHAHIEVNAPPWSSGIDEIRLAMPVGWDSNTAFDSLRIGFVNLFDVHTVSCPNPVNLGRLTGNGVLPSAVLGSSEFDVADVLPETCELEGVPAVRWSREDVSRPYVGNPSNVNDCASEGPDGYLDLSLKFDAPTVSAAILERHGSLPHNSAVQVQLSCELAGGGALLGVDVMKVVNN